MRIFDSASKGVAIMKTTLTIKNFRIFDSEGHTFEINPITILTGCNSSGKSSLVKACALFSEWIKQISAQGFTALFTEPLRFSNESLKLGRFDTAINSQSNENRSIVFCVTYKDVALEDIHVSYTFIKRKEDITNDAWLSNLTITDGRRTILEADGDNHKYIFNLLPLKLWACEISEYRLYKQELYYGGPTPASENRTEIGMQLAQKCKTLKEYRNKLCAFLEDKYTDEQWDKLEKYHSHTIHPLHPKYMSLPLVYNEKIQEIDNIFKEVFLTSIVKKINNSSNPYPLSRTDYLEFNKILRLVNSHYLASSYTKFSEFLGALENDHGLEFSMPIRDDITFDNLCTSMHMTKYGSLYAQSVRIINDIYGTFIEYDSKNELEDFITQTVIPFFKNVLTPKDLTLFNYIGTCQIFPQRVLSLNQGNDLLSRVLNEYINCTNNLGKRFKRGKYINQRGFFIDSWLKKFSVGSKLIIKQTEEGAGVSINIKDVHSNRTTNLCDMGYGIAQLVTMLLSIETAIFKSQYLYDKEHITLSMEEPESHLHPKYQSLLATLFADAFLNHNIHFIIETHSEYLIRAIQKYIAYGPKYHDYGLENTDVSIFYFNEPRKELRHSNEPQVRKIEIADDGCIINAFGPGFFDEALNLSTDLLRIKLEKHAK